MGETLASLALLAVLVEVVTNIIKSISPLVLKPHHSKLIALLVGITIGLVTKATMISSLGFNIIPLIDYILTGIIISKGSNAFHDFSSLLRQRAS